MSYKTTLKISDRKIFNSKLITFFLDGEVEYKDGSQNYITVANQPPFNNWQEGDFIIIDNSGTSKYSSNDSFSDTNTVSKYF